MRNFIVPPIPDSIWQKPSHFIAFGFGSGAIPIAPGTFGTLMAIPFYLLLKPLPPLFYLMVVVLVTLGSMWLCHRVSKEIAVHDHQGMCLDEIVGYLVTMIYVPFGITWMALGFILFRFFDIFKPWPISYLDKHIHGGIGIILDDVFAGIYSFLILQLLVYLL
ncbi:MAG: Phosphatidylglycerophosphatase A [uncultured bacterium]|nr:MAG: Phosphatidylglycerophosphatase A [uncultured bacterium]